MIEIEPHELNDLLFYSFRYTLGRMTYSVSTVAGLLTKYWEHLRINDKERIKKEITEAIESGCAGHDCDIAEWRKILELR